MLEVQDISFRFTENPVLDAVSFKAEPGQIISVIGESGSGKSTLLRAVYGLHDLEQGEIRWKGKKILGPAYNLVPGESYIKYLAQDFDLMPYTTVSENVGKFLSNFYPEEKKRRIDELLEMVELTEYANSRPGNLSGGQQQRVALARAMALKPELLLLDEPFSHIDSFRKSKLRRDLFAFLRKKQITCIIATHDSVDALAHADKTLVIKDGRIVREDSPQRLYQNPGSSYTASLFGEVNEIRPDLLLPPGNNGQPGDKVLVYTHELHVAEQSHLKVRVKESYFEGGHYLIRGLYHGQVLFFDHPVPLPPEKIIYLKADEKIVKERLNHKNKTG
ncbi:ABC transporter ATP-binding protein [Sinomicrobium weinanense]|uniref:ABC transporter ATP-binding protein n=1 Tax=Sinomicrobium weinanense TaxID=2842200 RepID=A0A926Q196_9FLAO|nr:ABC transporter ATP-binding protein [Sinomicrobium weinanense]MBC9795458.1 ABC transporter ATP-binding protein [Sinomicrobium weinanense]MBU3123983.1 ABC transporter ATP-binding protein [Sinomicrobium weinanense]